MVCIISTTTDIKASLSNNDESSHMRLIWGKLTRCVEVQRFHIMCHLKSVQVSNVRNSCNQYATFHFFLLHLGVLRISFTIHIRNSKMWFYFTRKVFAGNHACPYKTIRSLVRIPLQLNFLC